MTTTDETLRLMRDSLQELIKLGDAGKENDKRFGELAGDVLAAAGELDVMLSAGAPLPKAWGAARRVEIVHARPEKFGCQLAVFIAGHEEMTEDRTFSYIDIDPAVDYHTPKQWQAALDEALDPMHGHSPEFAKMIRRAFEQNKPTGQ